MKLTDKELDALIQSEEKHSFNKTFEFRGEKEKTAVRAPAKRFTVAAVAALLMVCIIAASVFVALKINNGITPIKRPDKPAVEPFSGVKGDYSGAKYMCLADTTLTAKSVFETVGYYSYYRKYSDSAEPLNGFFDKLTAKLLDGSESGAVSPVNIYMALSLLAECTEGASRQQILDVLGVSDIETLREQAKLIWLYNSKGDEYGRSVLANSIWLSSYLPVKEQCVNYLKDDHFASTFTGSFGDVNYVNALKQWLSDQTNGLLDDCINELEIERDTKAVLASTLYYKAKWNAEYKDTESGVFNGIYGKENCTFNKKTVKYTYIYKGDGFTAYAEQLSDGNMMWFFLPDKNKSVSDVINSGIVSYINGKTDRKAYDVTVRMPDFDVEYNKSIKEKLAELGITECMDEDKADFSALSDDQLYLASAVHAARFKADSEGVEGAAFTAMGLETNGEPVNMPKYDFTLDRPFVFAVVNNNAPLFIGCVNDLG
ncbi:MAG: hypothetical protein II777_08420 [Clostridia bacterium]|nr:hypothetical protein [Clostridia bacterium]